MTIGDGIRAYEEIAYAQREAERDEPRRDALDEFAARYTSSTGPHPPNECGDPADCPQHADAYLESVTTGNDTNDPRKRHPQR
jgi:hypothetical protein